MTELDAPLLEVADLTVGFGHGSAGTRVVHGVSFAVRRGETLAVIGESGSGKTVSSRAVMGLLPDTATVGGSVRLKGRELVGLPDREMRRHRGRDITMIFQDPARSLNPTVRVGPQVAEAIRLHEPVSRRQARRAAVELLGQVRLPAPERHYGEYPHQLSGGMRQRIMIAMALSCRPDVLIADEATTALDVTTQATIMELLRDLQRDLDLALVMISHNLALASAYADQVVVMYAGRVVERASAASLFADVRMPYTKLLLDAVPRVRMPSHTPLPTAAGQPPDPAAPPPGCAFAPRCPAARPRCRTDVPPLREHSPDHLCACWYPVSDGTGETSP
jgi:oligopeptide/dipeptide ABC transporter ATP-binding protein